MTRIVVSWLCDGNSYHAQTIYDTKSTIFYDYDGKVGKYKRRGVSDKSEINKLILEELLNLYERFGYGYFEDKEYLQERIKHYGGKL